MSKKITKLSTGLLNQEQLDSEVIAIADDLRTFEVETAFVTFGFGCERGQAMQHEIPVRVAGLVQFLNDSETDGTFVLGESDLIIRTGSVEFRLGHESDVLCSGPECPLLSAVRGRWAREYEHSYERRSGGHWHRLSGRPKDSRQA